MREVRAELTAHVGGNPSATQRALIERAAALTLHLTLLDAKLLRTGGAMTGHDSRQYLAWSNSLTRTLRELGLREAPRAAPTLQEYLAGTQAAGAPA